MKAAVLLTTLLILTCCGSTYARRRRCQDPTAICPRCTAPVNCLIDPCEVTTCPNFSTSDNFATVDNFPTIVCKADFCGGCTARFFLVFKHFKLEVTKLC